MTFDWTRLPPLTALRSFEAVARSRSFSEAARSLNVTHAATTQQLRRLDLGNPSLKVRAGEEGVGLVLEAEFDMRPQLRGGTLKPAPIEIGYVNQFFIVTPPWKPRPAVAHFIGWLRALGRQLMDRRA